MWVPQGVTIAMLTWALWPGNPYTYYTLLRWVCCAVFVFLAVRAHELEKQGWTWTLALLAVLYNPLARVSLEREVWVIVNLVTIAIVAASVGALRPTRPTDEAASR